MRTFELEVRMHEEYRALGLALVNRQWADPLEGMAVAHDILEHFPNDRGSTEEELMALGASILVRDEENYFCQKGKRNPNPGHQMSGDIAEQVNYAMQRGETLCLRSPGRTVSCEDYIECYFTTAIDEAMSESGDRNNGRPDEWLRPDNHWKIRGWLRRGYRKACKRYKGICAAHLCAVFNEIEKRADNVLKYADEGMRFIVKVDVDQGYVKFIENQPDDF